MIWLIRNLLILLVSIWSITAQAAPPPPQVCHQILSTNSSIWKNPLKWARENWAGIFSQSMPAIKTNRYAVHIASGQPSQNTFSPNALTILAQQQIEKIISKFQGLGFRDLPYTYYLIEAHPKSIAKHIISLAADSGNVFYEEFSFDEISTSVGRASASTFAIPNYKGKFTGSLKLRGSIGNEAAMYLFAYPDGIHDVQKDFTLAHETAHTTENPQGHQCQIWSEARADFLAFAATGNTLVWIFDDDFESHEKKWFVSRDLANPEISQTSEVYPSLILYHTNSLIISSVLLQLARKIGTKKVVEFVHWMDQIEDERALPFLSASYEQKLNEELYEKAKIHFLLNGYDNKYLPSNNFLYVQEEQRDLVMAVIQKQILRVFDFLLEWAFSSDLSPDEKTIISDLVIERISKK